jgi:DNA-binding transcriptional MerR regulator
MLDDVKLRQVELQYSAGLTSVEVLEVFAGWQVQMSEATLRKYVQLGLLPRSVRVGRKGKHRGSQGVYPVGVVRQILRIKELLADDLTIEQIQKDFLFMRSDLAQLEQTLATLFTTLGEVVKERRRRGYAQDVASEIDRANGVGVDLVGRLQAIELRLTTRANLQRVSAS